MDLNNLLRSVTDAIQKHNDPNQPKFPQNDLVNFVQDLFSRHGSDGNVRPASQDPLGDPGGQAGINTRPASQDPYGDPADPSGFGAVKPASQDPLGDPADTP